MLYHKLQDVSISTEKPKVLLRFVVDCHPGAVRPWMSISGHMWTWLEWAATKTKNKANCFQGLAFSFPKCTRACHEVGTFKSLVNFFFLMY